MTNSNPQLCWGEWNKQWCRRWRKPPIDCEFCSGCDNRGGGRIESLYQPYIDGEKEISEINAEYRAPFVRG